MKSETTNAKLKRLGYTTKKAAGVAKKHIIKDGETVFTGNVEEVNAFLEKSHCICGAWDGPEGYPGAMWDSSEDWCPIH